MSKETLIAKAQEGDAQALEKLWERTQAFAFTVSRRYTPTAYADAEDLRQCAYLGFHTAVMQHTGRYRFLSLVQWCVQRECQKLLDLYGSRRQMRTDSLDVVMPDGEHTLEDLIADESRPETGAALEASELVRDVRAAVADLPEKEMTIVTLHWLDGLSLADTGKQLEISAERVRQMEERAFAKLRADPVIASYAPEMRQASFRGGLSYFQKYHASSTERDALALVRRMENKRRRMEAEAYRRRKRWLDQEVRAGTISREQADAILAAGSVPGGGG